MNKRIIRIIALALAALLFLGLVITPVLANASSVGIIGGADGPTAIFVTNPGGLLLFLLLAAGVIFAVVILIRKRKH